MAKDIQLMGAVFPDVPSIRLPQVGGSLVQYDDTTDATAAAEDIAKNKTAYVNGVKITGTASGGGGPSNIVMGTFTIQEEQANAAYTINLPYTGNGHPVAVYIYPSAGSNNRYDGNWVVNGSAYAILCGIYIKRFIEGEYATPLYNGQMGYAQQMEQILYYKKSSSSSFGVGESSQTTIYNNADATAGYASHLRIKNKNTISVYVRDNTTSEYSYLAGGEYTYVVVYSE